MKPSPRVLATMILLNVLWAPVNMAFKVGLEEWSAAAIGLVRWSVFALLLWILLRQKWFQRRVNAKVPKGIDRWKGLAIGFFLFAPAHFLYILCQKYTSTLEATVLGTTGPLWIAVLAFFLLREKVSGQRWVAILIGCVGAYLVSIGFALPNLSSQNSIGNLMYMLAVLLESVGFVLAIQIVLRSSGIGVLAWQATGMGVAFALMPFVHPAGEIAFRGFSGSTWIAIAYLTLVTSLICFSIWYAIAEKVPLSVMVIMIGIQAPVSAFCGVAFLKEEFHPHVIVGSFVVLVAILLAALDRPKSLAQTAPEAS